MIELLCVLALIGILSVIVTPAVSSLMGGHALTRDGQLLGDQISLARQAAVSRNREIELRLIEFSEGGEIRWAVQVCEASTGRALHRVARLGESSVLSKVDGLSPLLAYGETSSVSLPSLSSEPCHYRSLIFRPNGRLKGNVPAGQDYLTLHSRSADAAAPSNFIALQIQPLTGRITIYRP